MARIDYDNWEERKFATARLRLDPQNLRLGSHPGVLLPRNIIAYMFDYEKVIYLIRSIALKGYFVNEMPIVVQEGGKYIVIEGNRRMTACKVLLDPSLAPPKYQAQIQYLAGTFNTDKLRKIKCVIAPSRDDARVIIQNRHTGGSQIEKWDGMKQDSWYVNDATRGFTVDEIAKIYLQQKNKVLASILRYKIYAEAKQIPSLSNETFRFVHGSEKFPISTLWRFSSSKEGANFLGFEYTSAGDVEVLLPADEYNKRFAAILEDLELGSRPKSKLGIDSRKLNTKEDLEKYIESLENSGRFDMSIVPEHTNKEAIDVEELPTEPADDVSDDTVDFRIDNVSDEEADTEDTPTIGTGEGPTDGEGTLVVANGLRPVASEQTTVITEEAAVPVTVKRKKPRKAAIAPNEDTQPLIHGAFTCLTTVPRIDEVFAELKEIPLDKPNAIAVLFRTLMDLLMTRYVEQKGLFERIKNAQIQEFVTSNRKIEDNLIKYLKQRHNIDETPEDIKRLLKLKEEVPERWSPSLGFMFKFFAEHAAELIPHASIREAFEGYVRQQATVTHSEFNSFVHNPFFIPNPSVLREFWSNFAPFITFLIDGITGEQDAADATE